MKNYKVRLKRKLYNKLREIESVKSSTAGSGDWSFTITHKDGSGIYITTMTAGEASGSI